MISHGNDVTLFKTKDAKLNDIPHLGKTQKQLESHLKISKVGHINSQGRNTIKKTKGVKDYYRCPLHQTRTFCCPTLHIIIHPTSTRLRSILLKTLSTRVKRTKVQKGSLSLNAINHLKKYIAFVSTITKRKKIDRKPSGLNPLHSYFR